MNDLVVADKSAEWRRLKALVLDSVSSPITRRVYNLGLDATAFLRLGVYSTLLGNPKTEIPTN